MEEEELVVEPKFHATRMEEELMSMLPDYAADCLEEYLRGNLPRVNKKELYSLYNGYHEMQGLAETLERGHESDLANSRYPLDPNQHTTVECTRFNEKLAADKRCRLHTDATRSCTIQPCGCISSLDHSSSTSNMDECDTI